MSKENVECSNSEYQRLIDKYVTITGNKYAAISEIAKKARKLAEDNDNIISHSEAMRWLASGIRPKCLDRPKRKRIDRIVEIINDGTCHVLDECIKKSVIASIIKSDKSNHLIFIYHKDLCPSQRCKVRVLCRLIWDKLNTEL